MGETIPRDDDVKVDWPTRLQLRPDEDQSENRTKAVWNDDRTWPRASLQRTDRGGGGQATLR
jgi:hypothetical protein